jgi:hypothetical protein
MLTSPAYAALSPSGRRVLALIDSKVTHRGGVAAISFGDIERSCGMIHGTCGFALRQVKLLGFVSVARGPGPRRRINTFRVSDVWRDLDALACRQLAAQARLGKPRTVPCIPWDDAR